MFAFFFWKKKPAKIYFIYGRIKCRAAGLLLDCSWCCTSNNIFAAEIYSWMTKYDCTVNAMAYQIIACLSRVLPESALITVQKISVRLYHEHVCWICFRRHFLISLISEEYEIYNLVEHKILIPIQICVILNTLFKTVPLQNRISITRLHKNHVDSLK